MAHHNIKKLYGTTNKRGAMKQVGQKYGHLAQLAALCNAEKQELSDATKSPVSLNAHYIICPSRNMPYDLFSFVQQTPKDPTKKVCAPYSLTLHIRS